MLLEGAPLSLLVVGLTLAARFHGSDNYLLSVSAGGALLAFALFAGLTGALFAALRARGFQVMGLFAPSLKAPDAALWMARQIAHLAPAAIVNATAFSGKGAQGTSPLDAGDVPVFQVALATSTRAAWAEAERGLSPADLAMHVVLPEVDGRLFAGVSSFKEPQPRDEHLQFARYAHSADVTRTNAVADRVKAWVDLAHTPAPDRTLALVLSTYPGKDWNMAHAVGLDAIASAQAILDDLTGAGHSVDPDPRPLENALATDTITWPLDAYESALKTLPQPLQEDLKDTWGAPEADFHFPAIRRGNTLIALQPERGHFAARDDDYHDLNRTPQHGYVAFYLWLRTQTQALVHIGAHGTLEWLPGKSVALSQDCWPEALTGAMPVLYPFIVNDPGEAAQAKRRIGAVTLGHIPPPMKASKTPTRLVRLEALLDEFSNADGLDPRRRARLQGDIRDAAQAIGGPPARNLAALLGG